MLLVREKVRGDYFRHTSIDGCCLGLSEATRQRGDKEGTQIIRFVTAEERLFWWVVSRTQDDSRVLIVVEFALTYQNGSFPEVFYY